MRSKAWVIVLLFVATGFLLHLRGDADRVPPSQPLSQLPMVIGSRSAIDIPIDSAVLEVLGKGVFLNRLYSGPIAASVSGSAVDPGLLTQREQPIGLFIGYFPTQRTGQAIHSPQNCLPGAGWTFESRGIANFTDTSGKPYHVGEYLISDGKSRQEVLYWYRSHGRSIANDYLAKLYTLSDSIRFNRTDAALIRVITPVREGEGQHSAHDRAVSFASQLTPLLLPYIPD